MIELELLKGLPAPWSFTDRLAFSGQLKRLQPTLEESRKAMRVLERLLVVAERMTPIREPIEEPAVDEDVDEEWTEEQQAEGLARSMNNLMVELDAPTFDQFTPDHLTHVPPEQRELEARRWIRGCLNRTLIDMARWLEGAKDEDAPTIGRELEEVVRPFLLRIGGMAANAFLGALTALRKYDARPLLEEIGKDAGYVGARAREIVRFMDAGRLR